MTTKKTPAAHKCDFKFVRRYWVGGRRGSQRAYWLLYQCECGRQHREKAS